MSLIISIIYIIPCVFLFFVILKIVNNFKINKGKKKIKTKINKRLDKRYIIIKKFDYGCWNNCDEGDSNCKDIFLDYCSKRHKFYDTFYISLNFPRDNGENIHYIYSKSNCYPQTKQLSENMTEILCEIIESSPSEHSEIFQKEIDNLILSYREAIEKVIGDEKEKERVEEVRIQEQFEKMTINRIKSVSETLKENYK